MPLKTPGLVQEFPGPCGAVVSASDSRARGPEFDIQSGLIISILLLLIQEGQLSVTGQSMCSKYFVNCLGGLSLPRKVLLG